MVGGREPERAGATRNPTSPLNKTLEVLMLEHVTFIIWCVCMSAHSALTLRARWSK
jgi:hypothetical protein